jgi:protein AFG1
LLKNKNEARRLINLVDALCESHCQTIPPALITPDEARCQIFIRAEAPLATLFFPDALAVPTSSYPSGFESNEAIMAAEALSETLHAPTRPNISLYDDKSTESREKGDREDRGGVWGKLGIFTGEDERFAYVRTILFIRSRTVKLISRKEPCPVWWR